MKQLTLVLCILFAINSPLLSQRWNLVHKNSVDLIIGGDYGFRFLQNKSGDQSVQDRLLFRNRYEDLKPNLRLGFNYNMAISERLFFKTGTRLVNPGYKTSRILVSDYEGYTDPQFFQNTESYDYSYLFLEIPLMVRYVYSENWCKSYIEGGFSANYYLQTRLESHYRNGETALLKFREDVTPLNFSGNISIGAEFLIGQIPAFIQMISRYQFSKLENNRLQEHFWSAGLETGIRYAF